jgi:hypothetical protein
MNRLYILLNKLDVKHRFTVGLKKKWEMKFDLM